MYAARNKIDLVTIRSPPPGRYANYLRSLSKIVQVRLVTGTTVPSIHLGSDSVTMLAYILLLAAFGKQIVATGNSPSEQYYLTESNAHALADAIIMGLGKDQEIKTSFLGRQ